MLIFDQLKKNDLQFRWLSLVVLSGLLVLLAGLWWVQVVLARDYQVKLEVQSYRTVRIPPVRGKILDRNRQVLADSRPNYNISLYLEELRKTFDAAYEQELARLRNDLNRQMAEQEKRIRQELTLQEKRRFSLSSKDRQLLHQKVRFQVASNAVARLGAILRQPLTLEERKFLRHYTTELALPLPVLANLDSAQIARFLEQAPTLPALDLETQPVRCYPFNSTAAHLLGQLRRDRDSAEGEEAFLNFPLPVLRGTVGIEAAFDQQLRGKAGAKSVQVNNLGYRQVENVWAPAEPGQNVVLTIDRFIQQAAEKALQQHGAQTGAQTRGAVVVMEAHTGDILALASSPTYDPNQFIRGLSREDWDRMSDAKLRPQINRAVQENYAPGSIFKIITGLACLETGLNKNQRIYNPGSIQVGPRKWHDLAPAGEYDFRRALLKSSNTYFISNGIRAGIQNIIRMAQHFHLGERTGLPTRQEVAGSLPSLKRVRTNWRDGDTANLCIGQGEVAVTPLQMAVATAAIANGGKVLWPRLVSRIVPQESWSELPAQIYSPARIRDELGVEPRHLDTLREAMLADVEDTEGTAYAAFHGAGQTTGLRVCGKTGTAQVMNERNQVVDYTTWFVSFAPFDRPRYVVVVMVEGGGSGGGTCGPIAREVYRGLEQREQKGPPGTETLAKAE